LPTAGEVSSRDDLGGNWTLVTAAGDCLLQARNPSFLSLTDYDVESHRSVTYGHEDVTINESLDWLNHD